MYCPSPLSWRDCPWFGPEIQGVVGTIPFSYRYGCRNGAHRYNQDLAKADTSPGARTVVPCTLSIPGRWAGPAIREIEMK